MALVYLLLAFSAGIAAGVRTGPHPALFAGLCLLLGGLAALFGVLRLRWLSAFLALALLGALWGERQDRGPTPTGTLKQALDSDGKVWLQGVVARGPEVGWSRGEEGRLRLAVELEQVAQAPAGGRLLLSVALGKGAAHPGALGVAPGDRIRWQGRLRRPRGLANPGLSDSTRALRANGVHYTSSVKGEALERVEMARPLDVRRWAFRVRLALRNAIDRRCTGEVAAFLRGQVIGERAGLDPHTEEGFRAAGATHVLSVSGLHLAAVAALFYGALRLILNRLPGLALRWDTGALAAGLALPAVAFYTLLTGEAVATVRSGWMVGVVLMARVLGRRPFGLSSWALAAFLILLPSPLSLYDVSFQLSFGSVLALMLLGGALVPKSLRQGDRTGSWRQKLAGWLVQLGSATVAAFVVTAPLCAHHFGEVTPAAPLGNLALVPLVEFFVVPLGLGGAALGALWDPAGALPLLLAAKGSALALWVAELFRQGAPLWLVRSPQTGETVALAVGLGCLLGALSTHGARRRILVVLGTLGLVAAWGSLGYRDWERRHRDHLQLIFLDIGQGDGALVELPDGRALLVDGGGDPSGAFDPGTWVIEPLLRRRGITRLHAVVLSHPHPDHMGGLERILERFAVDEFWSSGDGEGDPQYRRLLELAARQGTRVRVPGTERLGPVTFRPLHPWWGDRIAPPPGLGANDASLVLQVTYGGRRVLLTGDVEGQGEDELVERQTLGQDLRSDLLKVPHHGSRTSSSEAFLDAVHPSVAVMSLGYRNRFGFPHPEVEERYRARGIDLWRTDRDGAVTVRLHRDGRLEAAGERRRP